MDSNFIRPARYLTSSGSRQREGWRITLVLPTRKSRSRAVSSGHAHPTSIRDSANVRGELLESNRERKRALLLSRWQSALQPCEIQSAGRRDRRRVPINADHRPRHQSLSFRDTNAKDWPVG